jgi:hypothetical protein
MTNENGRLLPPKNTAKAGELSLWPLKAKVVVVQDQGFGAMSIT